MPPGNKKPTNASDLLLSELISEGMQRAKLEMNIVEFATDILEIELWPTQRAILKALYNLPYERGKWVDLFKGTPDEIKNKLKKYNKTTEDYWDEREILQTWAIENKTTWVEGQTYQELSLEAGMRSSKTAIISVVCAYEYFKLIQHPDPAKEFGLMAGSPIHLLVLATTEVQSKDTLFANIKGRLEQAPYFQGLRQQGKLIINTLDIQYPSKNITIWAGHSNCVSGATLIATTEGLRRADELVPTSSVEQTFPVRFSVPTLDGPKSVNTGICVGKQKTLKIRTRWGYEVEGSIRHPVMVMGPDGRTTWKRLPDIEPGDFVAVKRGWEGPPQLSLTEFSYNYKPGSSGTNAFVPPAYMNPDLARFLGYLIGDGCVTIKDRVGFKSMDYELVEDFAYLCKHLFNTELQLGTTQEDNKSQMYWAYNVKLKAYLEWLGMSSVKAPDKTIPWSIARADNESIANFLKALFDTDGYAATTNKLVGFTTTSEELAKQVQLLLLQLGIVSDRYKGSEPAGVRYWKGKCINSQHASFQVVMRGPEVDRYMSCIGFTASRKALAIPQRNHKVVCDVIPYVHKVLQNLRTLEIAGRVERPTKERIADWQLIRKTIGNTHAPGRPDHGGTSLLKLQRAIKYFQSTKNAEEDICYLESLADGQLFFDPVEHISEGTAYLYDFEVPEAHHFFSNGIVSHNSSGLVGRTLMVFAMDEANRFGIEGASGQSGVDLYANVGKGTLTLSRFGSKKIVISSAWCEGDLTDRLFGNAEGEASHILAFRLATWDMNPEFAILKEEHPSIKAEYMTRGVEAMRDYAGVRPGSEENFFHKHALARASKYPLQVDYIPKISVQQGPDGPRKFSSIEVVAPPEVVKGAMFSFGHCDPGLKHDSFGFLAAHPVVDPLTGNVIVQVNSVLEWRPVDKGRGDIYLVDYENVCDEIIKLSKSIHLKKLTFDHWNCYSVGSYVSTPAGLMQVENLAVGDSVIGRTSINKVVAKQVVKQQPVVRVRTKFGYDSVVTPHHPFWVIDYGWKNASDLQPGDKIALGTPAAADEGVDDPVKGLLYGYLVAEGDWNAHNSVIARTGKAQEIKFVRFSNTEDEVRQDYAKAFEQVFNYSPSNSDLGVRSGHDRVYDEVASNVATGAHNKHVPKFVLKGNSSTVGAFLAGLYEGDGNVRLNPKVLSVELNTVSEQLATEVHLLLQRLGIKASKKYFTNKILNGKQFPFYRITIYGQNIAVFADKVGFRSTRKKAMLSQAVAAIPTTRKSRSCDPWTQVVSVETTVADIVHLEVDNDHSYVGQGVVSHNSAMMIQRIYSAGISTELWKSSFSQTEQRKIYQVLREWIDQDRVRIPPPDQSPAAAKLHKELSELKLMNGRRIDHPKPKGSKDLSDCLACVVYRISQDERRFRYFETGTNNIRSSGEIHTARAITDLFAEERQLADRAKLIDPRRSNNPNSSSIRNTRISQKDW